MPVIDFDSSESLYWITDRPENEDEIAFDVYESYLDSFVQIIKAEYANGFIPSVSAKIKKLTVNNKLSLEYIERFLFLGWNTECLVKINDSLPNVELLRVNNQWKPIQVYYSIYSLCEATHYALTSQQLETHAKCLRQMSDYFARSSLKPWNYSFTGYEGNSKNPRTIGSLNFTPGLIIPNSLRRTDISSEESIACCLQAEHRKRIKEFIPQKGRFKYMYDPGNTTLLHFLYRLRIKSNYKDVSVFLAKAPDIKIKSFSQNLTHICRYTNAICEIIIAKKIGKEALLKIMAEFIKIHKNTTPIAERHKKYQSAL